jgi:hypothetical protein
MGLFRRHEKLPPSWEAKFASPNGEHYVTIQGRFTEKDAKRELPQRFSEQFPERPDWQFVSLTQVKPAAKRPRV